MVQDKESAAEAPAETKILNSKTGITALQLAGKRAWAFVSRNCDYFRTAKRLPNDVFMFS
jgi:hypothetical protein